MTPRPRALPAPAPDTCIRFLCRGPAASSAGRIPFTGSVRPGRMSHTEGRRHIPGRRQAPASVRSNGFFKAGGTAPFSAPGPMAAFPGIALPAPKKAPRPEPEETKRRGPVCRKAALWSLPGLAEVGRDVAATRRKPPRCAEGFPRPAGFPFLTALPKESRSPGSA